MMINKKVKAALRIILPVIFIAYACSVTFFTHTHIVNGVTIVHSHPFLTDENGNPDHDHTPAEIQLIHTLSTFFSTGIVILFFILGLFTAKRVIIPARRFVFTPQQYIRGSYTLRPPPVL